MLLSKNGRGLGELDGEAVELENDERCTWLAKWRARGALVHVRQSRRWRTRSVGVGGGFMVQFYLQSAHVLPLQIGRAHV